MAHKVEIENINNAVLSAWQDNGDVLHSWYYKLTDDLREFKSFIEGSCADCVDDGIIINREVFASKLNKFVVDSDEAINAINAFKSALPSMDDYWSVDIANSSGLTNPSVSGE
jgi:hypothetical protein